MKEGVADAFQHLAFRMLHVKYIAPSYRLCIIIPWSLTKPLLAGVVILYNVSIIFSCVIMNGDIYHDS